jgi:RNA polymerase sigma factor (sigma-70 family)
MPHAPLRQLLDRLHTLMPSRGTPGLSDAQLLERFCRQGDEAAFEVVVRRYEGLVLGVCRRVLRDAHSAEDAFQATFLALVRKAGLVGRRGSVAGWLYQVAYHTAVRAGAAAARRVGRERLGVDVTGTAGANDPAAEVEARELEVLLDAELSRLSPKYRDPVVLCYLEGKTYDEASQELGCPKGTLATRLAYAREWLRRRLAGRHLLGCGALAALFTGRASAASLVGTSRALTLSFASGRAAAGPQVVALAEGVLRSMWLTKIRVAAVTLLTVGLLGLGTGLFAYQAPTEEPPAAEKPAAPLSVAAGKVVGEVHCFQGHTASVQRVAFSPDGRQLLSCGLDGAIILWDLQTGREIRRFSGHGDRVDCVSFRADGRRFLSASWDWTVRLWDVKTGKELKQVRFQGEPGVHVSGVWWFPDGRRFLALATDHEALQIYDVRSGALLKDFRRHPGHIYAAALSPDGRRVLEASYDYVAPIRLWDVASGKLLREFKGYTSKTFGIAFSPDGRLALSTGEDPLVRLWDVETGEIVRVFKGHRSGVEGVAYSPDGRRVLTAGSDQTVRLWNAETGAEHCAFSGTHRVWCAWLSRPMAGMQHPAPMTAACGCGACPGRLARPSSRQPWLRRKRPLARENGKWPSSTAGPATQVRRTSTMNCSCAATAILPMPPKLPGGCANSALNWRRPRTKWTENRNSRPAPPATNGAAWTVPTSAVRVPRVRTSADTPSHRRPRAPAAIHSRSS